MPSATVFANVCDPFASLGIPEYPGHAADVSAILHAGEGFFARIAVVPSLGFCCRASAKRRAREHLNRPRKPEEFAGFGIVLEERTDLCVRKFSHFDLSLGWLG